ncbi:MAG: ROK family protein [Aeromicrobium sp.]|uniref:ROK family protein n=1 Tax=Aeromicrobium sp. TaxID=1871063 RepID=UPI0039E32BDE
MPIVVFDVGGSSARMAVVRGGVVGASRRVEVTDASSLVRHASAATRGLRGVAVSTAGFVDSERGRVRLSRAVPGLEGDLARRLTSDLGCPTVVVNDGEAHAYAAGRIPDVDHGLVAISLGTSVGLGVLDAGGRPLRPCSGENWDVGDWRLDTRASEREVWWALGSQGLAEVERSMGEDAGRAQYGYRLGGWIATLGVVFRPRTVVLSGGIARAHWNRFAPALHEELAAQTPEAARPQVVASPFEEAGLVGAAVAFARRVG